MCNETPRVVRASILRGMRIRILVQDKSVNGVYPSEYVLLDVEAPTLAEMAVKKLGVFQQTFTNADGSRFKVLVEIPKDDKPSIYKRVKK